MVTDDILRLEATVADANKELAKLHAEARALVTGDFTLATVTQVMPSEETTGTGAGTGSRDMPERVLALLRSHPDKYFTVTEIAAGINLPEGKEPSLRSAIKRLMDRPDHPVQTAGERSGKYFAREVNGQK